MGYVISEYCMSRESQKETAGCEKQRLSQRWNRNWQLILHYTHNRLTEQCGPRYIAQ